MITWMLATLALFVAQTWLPSALLFLGAGPGVGPRLRLALGPRDELPPASALVTRARRALANMHEALPVFLALALLHVIRGRTDDLALHGAQLFCVSRVLYVPAYLSGVPGVRSAIWLVAVAGLVMMLVSLHE